MLPPDANQVLTPSFTSLSRLKLLINYQTDQTQMHEEMTMKSEENAGRVMKW